MITSMDHAMTIRTKECYILGPGSAIWFKRSNWAGMMSLDKPLPKLSISFRKTEVTHLAPEHWVLLKTKLFHF
jgi:hypothetical protein